MELFKAHKNWAQRPVDERFSTIDEMYNFCSSYKSNSKSHFYSLKNMRAMVDSNDENEVVINGVTDKPMKTTHWAFGQLCAKANAPASYLRTLPADLTVKCLNLGFDRALKEKTIDSTLWENSSPEDQQALVYQPDGSILARAFLTWRYKRIWNADVIERLQVLLDQGWQIPPARPAFPNQPGTRPATEDDIIKGSMFSLSIKIGDLIAPAGLCASDRDMFAFLVDPNHYIDQGGEKLFRGMFVDNSEVGASSIGLTTFYWRHICGNLIVWGAENVKVMRHKHMGEVNSIFDTEFESWVHNYQNSSIAKDTEYINAAKKTILGDTLEDIVDTVASKRIKLGKRLLESAYVTATQHPEDGNPHSIWGIFNGLTRVSQEIGYMDERLKIDRNAAELMKLISI